MHKALFLDRDGVINRERGQYTWRKEDFVLTPGIVPFLQAAQARGYLLIVITSNKKNDYLHSHLVVQI